jgi:energy-coupling factor transporter ATP-binding protein EcfA2
VEKPIRITSVQFHEFKAFARYSLSLEHVNILVGPNNSGKSTILGAFRTLAIGLRQARSKKPERVDTPEGSGPGYRLSETTLPMSLENVHTNYGAIDSRVIFQLSNGNKLHLLFPQTEGCFLIPETRGIFIHSPASFTRAFPIDLTVVPVLGPVEHREKRRERETVVAGLSTHRASRHFRSYWHYFPDGFEDFAALIRTTWPGMDIQSPEVADPFTGELSMFCLEDRMTRELYWAGFGFQIWCQLLTHASRAKDATLLIVDEPEVYLHPDVQRQLLGILRDTGPDIVFATHSTEIMAEADPSEILLIDKRQHTASRLRDVSGVQKALEAVGSIQNITLTALARNRRVVFVEGDDDFRLLRRFARKLELAELGAGMGLTALESGGFGSWQRVMTLAAGIEQALGAPLKIAAIYDRDYYCDEEIATVHTTLVQNLFLAHVHERKEIENYLLIPAVLDRALARAALDRATRTGEAVEQLPCSDDLLRTLTEALRDEVQSQYIARRTTYLRSTGRDLADITRETLAWFTPRWNDLTARMTIVPGKEVLKALREHLQRVYGLSLTDAKWLGEIIFIFL